MGEHSTKDIPSTKQVFVPQETSSNLYDVSLVVEDGRREFKAHDVFFQWQVLSLKSFLTVT